MSSSKLLDFRILDAYRREQVTSIYERGTFPSDFRRRANEHLQEFNQWNGYNVVMKQQILDALVRRIYGPTAEFYGLVRGNLAHYLQRFNSCLTLELEFAKEHRKLMAPLLEIERKLTRCSEEVQQLLQLLGQWKLQHQKMAYYDQGTATYGRHYENLQELIPQARNLFNRLYAIVDGAHHGAVTSTLQDRYRALRERAVDCIVLLIKSCFLVSQQSDQVVKLGNKLNATVTLLAGRRTNDPNDSATVDCAIYSEDELLRLADHDMLVAEGELVVKCDSVNLSTTHNAADYRNDSQPSKRRPRCALPFRSAAANYLLGVDHAEFTGIRVNKLKAGRRDKTGDKVTDLKYALVFQTNLRIVACLRNERSTTHTELRKVQLRCYSQPIVCIVNVNQQPQAEFTVFWDNMCASRMESATCFCENQTVPTEQIAEEMSDSREHWCREPFSEPKEISWEIFSRELISWLQARTGCQPMSEHLEFVRNCLADRMMVTRTRVLDDRIERPLSHHNFWSWMYAVQKLLVDKVDPLVNFMWENGLIHFITHEVAEQKLRQRPQETAKTNIVRFCNSENPGKSAAVVLTQGCFTQPTNQAYEKVQVRSVNPWNAEALKSYPLKRHLDIVFQREFIMAVDGTLHKWTDVLAEFSAVHNQQRPSSPVLGSNSTHYVLTDLLCVVSSDSEVTEDVLTDLEGLDLNGWQQHKSPNFDPPSESDIKEMFDLYVK